MHFFNSRKIDKFKIKHNNDNLLLVDCYVMKMEVGLQLVIIKMLKNSND